MARLGRWAGVAILALAFAAPARAQVVGAGFGYGPGFGWGVPGYGWGWGFPAFGYAPPLTPYVYPWPGQIDAIGAAGFFGPFGPMALNPMFGVGLSPLGVESALIEHAISRPAAVVVPARPVDAAAAPTPAYRIRYNKVARHEESAPGADPPPPPPPEPGP